MERAVFVYVDTDSFHELVWVFEAISPTRPSMRAWFGEACQADVVGSGDPVSAPGLSASLSDVLSTAARCSLWRPLPVTQAGGVRARIPAVSDLKVTPD